MASNVSPAGKFPIVVGIDFDDTGVNALAEGVRIATMRADAELHVVWVVPNSENSSRSMKVLARRSDALAEAPRKIRAFLAQQGGRIEGLVGQKVVIHARLGSPADAILQLAVDIGAEIVVVGTHGHRGMKRVLLGSVAQQLVEIAHCPVVIARPRDYRGLAKSPTAEPVCPDCSKIRAETNGETLWCEYHSRPTVRRHAFSSTSVFEIGGHDPGIVIEG